jgi:uncharacterized glyoxalase superfamily protein PhnB
MLATTDLTSTQWQVADAIARQLVLDKADANELRKTIAYLRAYSDREDAGKKFFDYLNTLARNGNRIGHSKRTQGYLESIAATCQQYLETYKGDVPVMLQVLGWAARLMQYYKEAGPIGELNVVSVDDIPSEAQKIREEKINQLIASESLEVGKQLDAIVLGKKQKGSEVTYEISGVSYKEKEKKLFDTIPGNGSVIVEIKSLKDDGSINHVKFVRKAD